MNDDARYKEAEAESRVHGEGFSLNNMESR